LETLTSTADVVVTVVFEIVKSCVPADAVVNPVKVATPKRSLIVIEAVGEATEPVPGVIEIFPAVGTITMPLEPPLIVVDEVVVVDPTVTVLAAAPVPSLTVVAAASSEMLRAPVPLVTAIGPLVEVATVIPLDPEWMAVVEVELVEPNVAVFAPAPVATLTVVAAASALMATVPVPLVTVTGPLVEVATVIPVLPE
jgi:hypothetical protein